MPLPSLTITPPIIARLCIDLYSEHFESNTETWNFGIISKCIDSEFESVEHVTTLTVQLHM